LALEVPENPRTTPLQLLVGARLIRLGNLISVQLELLVGAPAGALNNTVIKGFPWVESDGAYLSASFF
jgi:hypothetical protein